ncbi:MAG: glycosyltransferase family 39 protein [Dehalococcoidia bacterium]
MAACIALGFGLRIAGLGAQSLWYDEGFSIYLAKQPLGEITRLTAGDIHPPLYYFLLHGWIALAGTNEFALRYLSLLPSVLTVPVVARFAGRGGRSAAALGALVAAVAPTAVWYGQETRMYSWLVLLVAISLDCFLSLLERRGRVWPAAIGWVLASSLAIYSHFYGAFVVAAQALVAALWVAVCVRSRPAIRRAGLLGFGFVLVAASYLPWLGPATTRLDGDQSYYQGTIDPWLVVRESSIALTVGATLDGPLVPIGLAIVGGAMTLGLWTLRRQPVTATLLAAAIVVPLLLLLIVSWSRPKFHPRYLLITLPAMQALTAVGLASITSQRRRRWAVLAGAGAIGGLTVIWGVSLVNAATDSRFARDDWRAAVSALQTAPGDAVALVSGHAFPVFTYYYGDRPYTPLPNGFTLTTNATLGYNLAHTLNEISSNATRIWVVRWQDDVVDPNGFLGRLLADGADREDLAAAPHGVGLERYRFRPGARFLAEPEIDRPLAVNYDNALTLLGFDGAASIDGALTLPAGGAGMLTLYWRAERALGADYKLVLRIVDERGLIWGRTDRRPAAYYYPTNRWKPGEIVFGDVAIPLEPTTPPGDYHIEVEVYAENGSKIVPLDIRDSLGNPAGQSAEIARLRIEPPTDRQPDFLTSRQMSAVLGPVVLAGTDLPEHNGVARPGETIVMSAFLRPGGRSDGSPRLRLEQDGRPVSDLAVEPIPGFPVADWPSGWTWRAAWPVRLPASLAGGELIAGLADESRFVPLTRLTIDAGERSFSLPERIANRTDVHFGDVAILRGWEARIRASPGDSIAVRLVWEALSATDRPLKIFVHLVDGSGRVVAQRDGVPADGRWPTTSWVAGQVIEDGGPVQVPNGIAPGDYRIVVGIYDERSGLRLPVGTSDSLTLGVVTIG